MPRRPSALLRSAKAARRTAARLTGRFRVEAGVLREWASIGIWTQCSPESLSGLEGTPDRAGRGRGSPARNGLAWCDQPATTLRPLGPQRAATLMPAAAAASSPLVDVS